MKTGYLKIISWLLLGSTALLGSCIDDNNDGRREKTKHYLLTVRSVDSDYQQIQENLSLYVFDNAEKLTKVVKCTLDVEVDVELDRKAKYSIVALGHSSDMTIPNFALGTSMEDAQITLATSDFANNKIATSPGDIFYGRVDLQGDSSPCQTDTESQEVVWIRRKVAALTIITRNIQSELNTTDQDFSYVVRQTYGTHDFKGNLKGEKVSYRPTSSFSSDNNNLVAPKFYTYGSGDDDGFFVDIYKGSNLLTTYGTDRYENPMLLKEGKHTVVLIDYKDHSNNNSGSLDVTCIVKDWSYDIINEGFN